VPQHHHLQRPGRQAGLLGPALLDGDIAETGGGDQGGGGSDRLGVGVEGRDPSVRPTAADSAGSIAPGPQPTSATRAPGTMPAGSQRSASACLAASAIVR
jgi:hypothetical protein